MLAALGEAVLVEEC